MYFKDKEKAQKERKKHEEMAKMIAGDTSEAVKGNSLCKECK